MTWRMILLALAAIAAPAATTVTGPLKTPFGGTFSGTLTITAPSMTPLNGDTVVAWQTVYSITNGTFTVDLEPNDTASPAGTSYVVRYRTSTTGYTWQEIWVVPTSTPPLTVAAVRTTLTPTPTILVALQQLSAAGAAKGSMIAYGTSWGVLPVGTNDQVLTADSTAARGVKWAASAGGGASSSVDLTDLKPSVASNCLTIAAGRARGGNYTPATIATGGVCFTGGTGNVKVFVDAGNNLVCLVQTGVTYSAPTGALTCSGAASPSYPANSIPLADVAVTTGTPAISSDDRAFLSTRGVSAGTGISISEASGVASVAIDTATVPQLGGANVYTGANDLTGASQTAPMKTGTTLPATCVVGDQFFKSNAAAGSNLYGCTALNTWTVQTGSAGVTPSIRDTYANLPTCNASITGQIFKLTAETSGYKEAQCNGSSWQWYISNIPITLPGAASGWTNLGSSFSTAPTDVNGGIYFSVGNQTTAQGMVKAVPGSTPYTLTVGFTTVGYETASGSLPACVLIITDGTNWAGATKSDRFGWDSGHTGNLVVNYYSAPGTYGSTLKNGYGAGIRTPFQMLRYRDNGTNRYFEVFNGLAWETVYSEGRTINFTATHFGVACGNYLTDSGVLTSLALHHYKVD